MSGDLNPTAIEDAVDRLEQLAKKVDLHTGNSKKHLLIRARNLVATLLDQYSLFHTKIVVQIVKECGGDEVDEVTAWLHDIGKVAVDDGHRTVGAIWAQRWLKKFYITDEEIGRIIDGIKHHGTKDDPKTKTGELLKLADALAVFDDGWAHMIASYYRSIGKAEKAIKMFEKKWRVIETMESKVYTKEYEKRFKELVEWLKGRKNELVIR